ncbi:hypothetical protein OIE68_30510 [Nocardia vinacea]|uniref:Uncharacterized protein n=1 Tax=Nocardia vinacea TaxID=96468 RepID=A0ABZ1Z6L5_9NOCA|nr:hypothetical protein OIE68_30510 [Nocardia vinacea]
MVFGVLKGGEQPFTVVPNGHCRLPVEQLVLDVFNRLHETSVRVTALLRADDTD